jgi:DNA topoisomerase-1
MTIAQPPQAIGTSHQTLRIPSERDRLAGPHRSFRSVTPPRKRRLYSLSAGLSGFFDHPWFLPGVTSEDRSLAAGGTPCPSATSQRVPLEPQIKYAFDDEAGIRRRRAGRGFVYVDRHGRLVDQKTRMRIKRLVIPPAWTEVWICPDADGHIQATGRDARSRKQYIYHPAWRQWRELTKFQHILDFAAVLPKLRQHVARDLDFRRLSRERVLATAIRVLDRTLMRVGNDEYARQNQSYGLTTLRNEHIENAGSRVRFAFRGKHGKPFEAEFNDRRVAAILRRLEGLPGQHVFQYLDDAGKRHRIGSDDINAYIRKATDGDFTAKDIRTWAATVLAVVELSKLAPAASEAARRKNIVKAVTRVAARLGNTPAVCRSSYVHPEVMASYLDGTIPVESKLFEDADDGGGAGLLRAERAVLRFLRRRIKERETTETEPKPALAEALALSVGVE